MSARSLRSNHVPNSVGVGVCVDDFSSVYLCTVLVVRNGSNHSNRVYIEAISHSRANISARSSGLCIGGIS
jgi:hypothetical protein